MQVYLIKDRSNVVSLPYLTRCYMAVYRQHKTVKSWRNLCLRCVQVWCVFLVWPIYMMIVFMVLLICLSLTRWMIFGGHVLVPTASGILFVYVIVLCITSIQVSVFLLLYLDVMKFTSVVFGSHLWNLASLVISWVFIVLIWKILIFGLICWIIRVLLNFLILSNFLTDE